MQKWKKATDCFKKYLQLAWYLNDLDAELRAYENLGIDYFYMGEMAKANFYDRKFTEGIFEGPDSVVKKVAVNIIKNKVENIRLGRFN